SGDVPGALQAFAHALELDPRDAKTWLERGRMRRAQGELEAAKSDFARALERMALGDPAGAIKDCTHVIEAEPARAQAWATRGVARLRLGDQGGAADAERALELEPDATWAPELRKILEQVKAR